MDVKSHQAINTDNEAFKCGWLVKGCVYNLDLFLIATKWLWCQILTKQSENKSLVQKFNQLHIKKVWIGCEIYIYVYIFQH